MTTLLLPLAPLLPLLLVPFAAARPAPRWLPLAAVPALMAALLVPVGSDAGLPWLMLGTQLALDETGRLFLLFSSTVWLAAAVYLVSTPSSYPPRGRFGIWFLAAMAGNFLLIVAADVVTFYAGFTLMGLSAYGLLLGGRGQRARAAGRVYLGFTLAGEVALFAALVLLVADTGSLLIADLADQRLPDAALALLLLGFGIKVALPGLHLWLPPAYTAGPIVAVAVLSGPMMKAGLLGWLRFVPPQAVDGAGWGMLLAALGAVGVLFGVALGVMQRRARAVLAYSSIAKMGLISALFGAALVEPAQAPALIAALTLFAMHHLLVKSALFLGVAEWERLGPRTWVLIGSSVLALTLIGAPWTGGAAAKAVLAGVPLTGLIGLDVLMAVAATGTVLLMARFLFLLSRGTPRHVVPARMATTVWLGLVMLAFWAPFLPGQVAFEAKAVWPIAGGLVLAATAWVAVRGRSRPDRRCLPAGLLSLVIRHTRGLRRAAADLRWPLALPRFALPWPAMRSQAGVTDLQSAGLRWLAVLAALLFTTWVSG